MTIRRAILLALALLVCAAPPPREKSVKPGINDHFKKPNVKEYLGKFETESREIFLHRNDIVKALGLKPGMAVADVGAGTGLFTLLFAKEVGPKGKVYAVDIAQNFLDHIARTSKKEKLGNVVTVRCTQRSSELPANSVDVIFICDTYHHFEFPQRTLASLHRALRPGGRMIVIDFHRIPGKTRPFLLNHVRAGQEVFEKEIASAGFKKVGEEKKIPLKENYFLRFEKKAQAKPKGQGSIKFNRDVRPILSDACFACHGPDRAKRKADLRLDTEEGGKAVVKAGDPDASDLIGRITSDDPHRRMPPLKATRKLQAKEIETLKEWIRQGAKWEAHWAYVAPVRPDVPEVRDASWARNPIDRFVQAVLDREGLKPSPEAPRHTLIRRLTLDLTGLPPTPEEVDAFVKDPSPGAYERVVDRLLSSPRYGERLAYDWLDSARYADSNGFQADRDRVQWPWRDWAIAAFNRNLSFDRFTVEQLAGDLLPNASREQKVATGFNRNHMLNGEGGRIQEESRTDYVHDRVETTATVWMGLTLGCARCHDHKFDPFTMKDYYRLFAFFNNINETGGIDRGGNANPMLDLGTEEELAQRAALQKEVREQENNVRQAADASSKSYFENQLRLKRQALNALDRRIPSVMIMQERPKPRQTHILVRGQWDKPGDKVTAGVIEHLANAPKGAANRLGLARWLVSREHPLTARVIVNRYWQLIFGTGLVKTAEDFGVQGEPPSHPELLDWLAVEFQESGWDLKQLLRRIVTSSTYRQSSAVTAALQERDPDNRLLARGARYRLSSPVLRDQALALAGLLVEQMGGRPVRPYQPPGIWEEMSFGGIRYVQSKGADLYRRSLYTFWRRTVGPTNLFDTPARQVCVVRPSRTNTPVHALVTLNDPTYVEAARVMAQRVLAEPDIKTIQDRLNFAFRLATSRDPDEREQAVLQRARNRLIAHYKADLDAAKKLINVGESAADDSRPEYVLAAYTAVCGLLMNLDEVMTRE